MAVAISKAAIFIAALTVSSAMLGCGNIGGGGTLQPIANPNAKSGGGPPRPAKPNAGKAG